MPDAMPSCTAANSDPAALGGTLAAAVIASALPMSTCGAVIPPPRRQA
jgi:hypothetical protein